MKRLIILFLVFAKAPLFGQIDDVGSGHAIQFDGIDDYVDLGDIYDDLALPFTISAWIYIDPGVTPSGGPVFVSQDNAPIYNGFWFFVGPTSISIEYGDGRGENLSDYRKGKAASIPNLTGRWVHASAVMKSASDIDLYINGVNVGGSSTGLSSFPMASQYPTDVAKIGYFLSNGRTYHFNGRIDHLQVFNRALSDVEIRQNMTKKLKGNELGLIGYWTFDETTGNILSDKSINRFDGQLKGSPTRIYSGAPIGDENILLYTNSWSGVKVIQNDLSVENITGNPFGVHLYKVSNSPSQINGLNPTELEVLYYGIFIADTKGGDFFDIKYKDGLPCKLYSRLDNSQPAWIESTKSTLILERVELISMRSANTFQVDLGTDKILCDQESTTLLTNLSSSTDKLFLWNTGETSKSILVNQSGKYSVRVTDGCESAIDSILVSFLKTPPVFSLGADEINCEFKPHILSVPSPSNADYSWQWQDGSTLPTLEIKDFGIFWVTIKNACGESSDSIKFSKTDINVDFVPNVITPNGDAYNQNFELQSEIKGKVLIEIFDRWGKRVFSDKNYNNDWSGFNLATGVYFYRLTGVCKDEYKGTLHILD